MRTGWVLLGILAGGCGAPQADPPAGPEPLSVSGRYPHLALFNRQGECGIGAVVPWAGRLWTLTYAPHRPGGSDDKLYEIDDALGLKARPESVGGTPASRLIHRESGQLFLGPYVIDREGGVRVLPPSVMPGRLTAAARHLTDPAGKVLIYDMEGLLYEVDVKTLEVKRLFVRALPGWHGKGGYSGQGRLVLANNGEEPVGAMDRYKPFDTQVPFENGGENAGALGEWDGRSWTLLERRQFAEVSGPGGIEGAPNPGAPLWALGWDRRSVLLKVRSGGRWSTCRLPKADYSYDGRHGWHTEWPRIREVMPGRYLANMHGGWFEVPAAFEGAGGPALRAIGSHLKITGDFTGWRGRIVFGCDDAAQSTFGGAASLVGQSQSNLWFASWGDLSRAGRPSGFGGPWLEDDVEAGAVSDPLLIAGYPGRVVHVSHAEARSVRFTLEAGSSGAWRPVAELDVPAQGYAFQVLPADLAGDWMRVRAGSAVRKASVYVHCGPGGGALTDARILEAFPRRGEAAAPGRVLLRSASGGRGTLTVVRTGAGPEESWEVDAGLKFRRSPVEAAEAPRPPGAADHPGLTIGADEASAFVIEGSTRFRLPVATGTPVPESGRIVREAVTERSLLNVAGTFHLLPRANSGGVRKLKPLCTHDRSIGDFCSWRGLLVLGGLRPDAVSGDGHVFRAEGGGPALWFGDVDDLWKFGKPVGRGGPWRGSPVKPGVPSDPYLMTGYDRKTLTLSHDAGSPVEFGVEVDVTADGRWRRYARFKVPAGESLTHRFPEGYAAHWVRVVADAECRAGATLLYE